MQADLRECYRILDVEPDVPMEDVKRSYRELVKVWHPDRFTHDLKLQHKAQEKLKQINFAYERICAGGPIPQTSSSRNQSGSRAAGRKEAPPPPPAAPPPRPEPTNAPRKETNWAVAFIIVAVAIVFGVVFLVNNGMPSRSVGGRQASHPEPAPTYSTPAPPNVAVPPKARQRLSIGQISAVYQEAQKKRPNLGMTLQEFSRYAQKQFPDYDFSDGINYSAPIDAQKHEAKPSENPAIASGSPTRESVTPVQLDPKPEMTTADSALVVRKEVDSSFENPPEPARPDPSSARLRGQTNVGARGFFTVGSTKDEVIAVQGTPDSFTDRVYTYSYGSSVEFRDGRVVSWNSSPVNPLKAKLPVASTVTNRGFFTTGSSKEEVLVVQGTPDSFTDTVYTYSYGSSVEFRDGRVVSWKSSPVNPLKAKLGN